MRRDTRRQPSRTASMDWQFCEDETTWQAAQTAIRAESAAGPVPPHARIPRAYWIAAASLASVILVVGGLLYRTARAGLARVENELTGAVTADLWLAGNRADHVELVALQQDRAIVHVEIEATPGQPAVQRTLLYRQTPTGWRRSAPAEVNAATWGRWRELESDWFIFHYYSQDGEAVQHAAAQLDQLYPTLYAAFFSDPPPADKVEFDVNPALLPEQIDGRPNSAGHYAVSSPASYAPDLLVSDADLLTHSVLLILLGIQKARLSEQWLHSGIRLPQVELHRSARRDVPPPVVIVDGIGQWVVWRSGLPIAAGRDPLVRWVFADLVARDRAPAAQFAPFWPQIHVSCPWMSVPQLLMPLLCAEPQPLTLYLAVASYPRIFPDYDWHGQSSGATRTGLLDVIEGLYQANPMAAKIAMATVVEYATTTYDAAHLPDLVDAAGRGESWDTLIPGVFGISRREFEEGWRVWLLSHYELAPASELAPR